MHMHKVLAATAGEVLLHGLQGLRSSRTAWASFAALPGEENFTQSLNQVIASLERLTQSPFICKLCQMPLSPCAQLRHESHYSAASQTAKLREASSGTA